MKTSSKGKSEMLGRMQWKHLAKVSQKMKTLVIQKEAMKTSSKGKSEMLVRMQWI